MGSSGTDKIFAGSIPKFYDTYLVPLLFEPYAADLVNRLASRSLSRVLEVAAGTGVVTRALASVLPERVAIVATDLNQPMLDQASALGTTRPVEWRQADAMRLPFQDGTFDALVCQFGVMFFPDKDKGHREAHRVLVSGGRYLFSVWDSHRHNPFGRIAHETAGSFFPADPPQFYNVPFSYYRIDPIKESLIEAGFSNINVAVVKLEKELPDVMRFARALVHGNPLIDQIRTRGGVEPDRVVDALARALRAEFGDPGRMPLQAIVFSAVRAE